MFKIILLTLYIVNLLSNEIKSIVPEFTFPFWQDMHRLNKNLIQSQDHNAYVDIYVNDLAKVPYVQESEKFSHWLCNS